MMWSLPLKECFSIAMSWSRPLRDGTPGECHTLHVTRHQPHVTRTGSAGGGQHPKERLQRNQKCIEGNRGCEMRICHGTWGVVSACDGCACLCAFMYLHRVIILLRNAAEELGVGGRAQRVRILRAIGNPLSKSGQKKGFA